MSETVKHLLEIQTVEINKLKGNLRYLLAAIGNPGICRVCGVKIWWVKHRSGTETPYTEAGLNHFADCSKADRFRKRNP